MESLEAIRAPLPIQQNENIMLWTSWFQVKEKTTHATHKGISFSKRILSYEALTAGCTDGPQKYLEVHSHCECRPLPLSSPRLWFVRHVYLILILWDLLLQLPSPHWQNLVDHGAPTQMLGDHSSGKTKFLSPDPNFTLSEKTLWFIPFVLRVLPLSSQQ